MLRRSLFLARSAGQRPVVNTSYRSVFDSPFPLVTRIEQPFQKITASKRQRGGPKVS